MALLRSQRGAMIAIGKPLSWLGLEAGNLPYSQSVEKMILK